jgi:hypothetical protein
MSGFSGALFDAPQRRERLATLGIGFAMSAILAVAAPFATVPVVRLPWFIGGLYLLAVKALLATLGLLASSMPNALISAGIWGASPDFLR